MEVVGLDHVVLYSSNLERTIDFYVDVLGMDHVVFEDRYHALHFGTQKINLHEAARPWAPHAARTEPGTFDVCLLVTDSPEAVAAHLGRKGVPIIEGPCTQTGAQGAMTSVYIRDPDGNLIEIASYPSRRQ